MKVEGKHMKTGTEITVPTHSLRTRVGIAAAAGCLSLALVPALAMAAPAGTMEQQNMGGQAPAMQQGQAPAMQQGQAPAMQQGQAPSANMGSQENMGQAPTGNMGGQGFMGQAPSGEMGGQAPTGQAPSTTMPSAPNGEMNGQQAPAMPNNNTSGTENTNQAPTAPNEADRTNGTNGQAPTAPNGTAPDAQNKELDEKIINAIDNEDIKAQALAGNPDTENKRPAIPEGEINVQQLIDSIRHAFLGISQDALPQFNGEAPADLPEGTSTEKPEGAPKDTATNKANNTSDTNNTSSATPTAPQANEKAPAPTGAPTGDDTSTLDIFKQIFEKVISVLKGK